MSILTICLVLLNTATAVVFFVFGYKVGTKSREKVVRYIVQSEKGTAVDTINVEEEVDVFDKYAYGSDEDLEEVLYEETEQT